MTGPTARRRRAGGRRQVADVQVLIALDELTRMYTHASAAAAPEALRAVSARFPAYVDELTAHALSSLSHTSEETHVDGDASNCGVPETAGARRTLELIFGVDTSAQPLASERVAPDLTRVAESAGRYAEGADPFEVGTTRAAGEPTGALVDDEVERVAARRRLPRIAILGQAGNHAPDQDSTG